MKEITAIKRTAKAGRNNNLSKKERKHIKQLRKFNRNNQ